LIVTVDRKYDIKPREALRGGRVECYVHYKKIDTATHCMRGFDLTSLYPSMMLHNLPLKDSVVVDCDAVFIEKLEMYAKFIACEDVDNKWTIATYVMGTADTKVGFVKC
jgi:hypothetical protein